MLIQVILSILQCVNELFSFAAVFKHFNWDILTNDGEVDYEEANVNDGDGGSEDTFTDCLAILLNPQYNLIDAYPNLCRIYAI